MTSFKVSDKTKFLIVLGIVLFEIAFVHLTKDQPRVVDSTNQKSVTVEINEEDYEIVKSPELVSTTASLADNNSDEKLEVHFIDVGQGDAIYIGYDDFDMLIDGGNNEDGPFVVQYLEDQGVENIDLMVATHAHEDHIGGLDDVLKTFKVKMVIDSGQVRDTKTYNDYISAVKESGATLIEDDTRTFMINDQFKVDIIDVIDDHEETNNNSVITKLEYRDVSFLFTGDLEAEVEQMLLMYPIEATVYKAGHHGSSTSNSDMFLRRVHPDLIIVSAGLNNKYGHPHQEALTRLLKQTDKIYGTWENGTIIVMSDGKTMEVSANELVTMEDAHASGEMIEAKETKEWWYKLFQ